MPLFPNIVIIILFPSPTAFLDRRLLTQRFCRRGVVDAVVKGGQRTLWRGNKSWIVWFTRNWIGSWFFDLVLPGMFGLARLAKIVKEREGRKMRCGANL